MEKRVLILDEERIGRKLQRMAYQIWEHNSKEPEMCFVAIQGAGTAVAAELARRVREISPMTVTIYPLKVNKKDPLNGTESLPEALSGKSVLLIDDVANSGRTMLYAMLPLLPLRPARIMTAVLVVRKHKSFPISADIVGHTVATTLQDHIEVVIEQDRIAGAYLL